MNDELAERMVAAMERQAAASEELNALAKEERDIGESFLSPPICPSCGTFNPNIHTGGRPGEGEFAGFVLVAQCGGCNEMIYALAQGWLCFSDKSEAQQERERRLNGDQQHS